MTSTPAPPHILFGRRLSPSAAMEHLQRLERGYTIKNWLMLGVGVPASLLGPAVVAMIAFLFSMRLGHIPSFGRLYLYCCAIVIPIMYVIAWTRRGSLTEQFAEETEDYASSSFVVWRARGHAAGFLFIFDVLLFAPQMVIFAARRMHARLNVGRVDLPRVAEAVAVLAAADGGISPGKLLRPGEGGDVLGAIFDYLLLHDQIGISKAGDRVWMDSDVRRKLLPERV